MNSVLDAIKAHAKPEVSRRLEIPEWSLDGEKSLVITYTMVTLQDLSTVAQLTENSSDLNRIAPYIVALKARDEAGNAMFKMGDAVVIRETAAPEVVKSIALRMLGRVSLETARKN